MPEHVVPPEHEPDTTFASVKAVPIDVPFHTPDETVPKNELPETDSAVVDA